MAGVYLAGEPAAGGGPLGVTSEDSHPLHALDESGGDLVALAGQPQRLGIGKPGVWSQPRGEPAEAEALRGFLPVCGDSRREQVHGSIPVVAHEGVQVHPECETLRDAVRDACDDLAGVAVPDEYDVAQVVSLE